MAQLFRQFNFSIARKRGRWLRGRVGVVEYFEHAKTHAYRVPVQTLTAKQVHALKEPLQGQRLM
jgi:hypothetical protein